MRYNFEDISGLRPGRTAFDLSERHSFDCYVGQLIPSYWRYMYPGDTFEVAQDTVVRLNPMISPSFVRFTAKTHTFFVPLRILWRGFEAYYTKGVDGQNTYQIPRIIPINSGFKFNGGLADDGDLWLEFGSLWDYFGFPFPGYDGTVKVSPSGFFPGYTCRYFQSSIGKMPSSVEEIPHFFPYAAYNMIWNYYYRDENLQSPYPCIAKVAPTEYGDADYEMEWDETGQACSFGAPGVGSVFYNMFPLVAAPTVAMKQVCWKKDYLTSCLPFQQRGIAPALPITLQGGASFTIPVGTAMFNSPSFSFTPSVSASLSPSLSTNYEPDLYRASVYSSVNESKTVSVPVSVSPVNLGSKSIYSSASPNLNKVLTDNNTVSGSGVAITAPELRLMFQLQKWMERNARGGVRFPEFLQAHFGVFPRDERLQRPEYIGGASSPIIISEVLQTSQSTDNSELGQYAGYGLSTSSDAVSSYTAVEPGIIMSLFHITYDPLYVSGMPREVLNNTVYDWFFPEFVNLSDQAVLSREVCYTGNPDFDNLIFGYQGRYDELRTSHDRVSGSMRTSMLGEWTLRRQFLTPPQLNSSFVTVPYDSAKPLFAEQTMPPFICHLNTRVRAIRPIPYASEPGLLDHH